MTMPAAVPRPALGGGRLPPDSRTPPRRGPAEIIYLPPRAPITPPAAPRGRQAVIYKAAPSVMQAGQGRRAWVLEFEPQRKPERDFLMGWTGGGDPDAPTRLTFPDRSSAERYVRARGLDYVVRASRPQPRLVPRTYAENFTSVPLELLAELRF